MRKICLFFLLAVLSGSLHAQLTWDGRYVYNDEEEVFAVPCGYEVGMADACYNNIGEGCILVASQTRKKDSCCRRPVGNFMSPVIALATWTCCCPAEETHTIVRIDFVDIGRKKSIASYEKKYENHVEIKSFVHNYVKDPEEIVVTIQPVGDNLENVLLMRSKRCCGTCQSLEEIKAE